jgi:hypothetical protein
MEDAEVEKRCKMIMFACTELEFRAYHHFFPRGTLSNHIRALLAESMQLRHNKKKLRK